jgi:hypothetical protein
VHGKGSLLGKMPGDDWQKLRQPARALRLHVGHPGKKLLFMGPELSNTPVQGDEVVDSGLGELPPVKGADLSEQGDAALPGTS